MIESGIYQIKNTVNGKIYIGSSSNLTQRKKDHFRKLRHNRHSNAHLQNAFNKYGEDNFVFEVIEYVEDKNKLISREQYYIDKHNVVQEGYNLRPKAENNLGMSVSEETKKKLSEVSKGRRHTEEARRKMSEYRRSNPLVGEKNGMYGKHHTEEARRKMSISQKGKNLGKHLTKEGKRKISKAQSVRVLCVELNIIFPSIREANKYIGHPIKSSHISECCKGKVKRSGGYHWKYVD